jgi:hypothetical protein
MSCLARRIRHLLPAQRVGILLIIFFFSPLGVSRHICAETFGKMNLISKFQLGAMYLFFRPREGAL